MSKIIERYVCQQCGAVSVRWQGQCQECQAWNSIVQETGSPHKAIGQKPHKIRPVELQDLRAVGALPRRYSIGIGELDRVLGGGLVPGSAVLIGGDPGIGKSTLLLQAAGHLSQNYRTLYFSGEESIAQLRLRARRLGISAAVEVASELRVEAICGLLKSASDIGVVIIDSIQTMYLSQLDSGPGSIGQVRASAHALIETAKTHAIALFLVGHVTKDGILAGPRVLEHMVDAVLYFEGERTHRFRILRSVKNRYATTDEIGVFDMTGQGLCEVTNPSELFLSERQQGISGTVVFAGMEGSRPLLVEVQALLSPSYLPSPRRAVVGCDLARLAMLLAVLEGRCGLRFGGYDVYVNVVGGLKISEPAADLAIAVALLSSLADQPMPADMVIFGELGLSGEVRRVNLADIRLREAAKLGFVQAMVPPLKSAEKQNSSQPQIKMIQAKEIQGLSDLAHYFPKLVKTSGKITKNRG